MVEDEIHAPGSHPAIEPPRNKSTRRISVSQGQGLKCVKDTPVSHAPWDKRRQCNHRDNDGACQQLSPVAACLSRAPKQPPPYIYKDGSQQHSAIGTQQDCHRNCQAAKEPTAPRRGRYALKRADHGKQGRSRSKDRQSFAKRRRTIIRGKRTERRQKKGYL